ncbi:hypothetical protein KFL_002030110 [Klebsormidium nitens]|uniref:Uncharacterized protein n=1 Tax=Klebsormidium nitens TaxID=105231 RepID=A0A1Y1I9H0_KLENI|nr:hypothetical protein KFL_002030110 [Klebsormidium nitens]|eukprot:GAQ84728.1 hypothetical protein KFL_002030110 [Klebsormidium nitens]
MKRRFLAFELNCFWYWDATLLEWPKCVQLFQTGLESRVKGDTSKVLVNDFSTTDLVSQTASQIVVMDSMKHYFRYIVLLGMAWDSVVESCGIPSVTLHGTLEDWSRLVEKARALRALSIGLDWWLDKLDPVLEQLMATYRGNVDHDWWSQVLSTSGYRSGPSPDYITGWVCAFFPYDEEKGKTFPRKNIFEDNPPKGLVECPFIIRDARVRPPVETDNLLVAGSCGVSVTEDGRGVTPCIGWLVKKDPNARKGKESKNKKRGPEENPVVNRPKTRSSPKV